jgi:hypothetical protein
MIVQHHKQVILILSIYPSFTTKHNAPNVGTGSNATATSIQCNWTAPTGGGSATYTYTLEVDDSNDFSSVNYTQTGIASGTLNNIATGLSANTTYYYRVKAVNTGGDSAWSSISVGYSTLLPCSVLPTISTTVVATSITSSSASSGGQTITSGTDCTITAKGVCYGTVTNPTTGTSDGTGTTNFTSSLTGLSAETLYYYRAFATNAFGTNYANELSFRTLSTEPSSHPSTLSATAVSSSQINLTFSAASTITNADGFIILRRTGSNPTSTNITDGIAPTSLTMPLGTTFISDINSTSTTTYNNTGLPNANTQYNYAIIAYNWDGVNPETYNYYTGGTIKTANAITLCTSTSIPYSQDFESVTTPAIPSCTYIQNAGSGNNWITSSPDDYGFNTKVLEYSYSNSDAANAWFYTQGLNLTNGTSYRLTFSYGNNSTSYIEKLKVAYGSSTVNTAMTNSLIDLPSINDATIHTSTIDFTPSSTGVFYIGFNCYSSANQYDLYIDDISVTLTPTCLPPTAVTSSSVTATTATISWTASVTIPSNGYQYEVRTSGAAGSGATGLFVTSTTAAGDVNDDITGLADNTTYQVYVRSDCGGSDFSTWTTAYNFTTTNITAPTATAATSIQNTQFTANWDAVPGATGYRLDVSTSPTFGTSGPATLDEGFESGLSTSGYTSGTVALSTGNWITVDILQGSGGGNYYSGSKSAQMKADTGAITSPSLNSVSTVTFWAKSPSGTTLTIKKIVDGSTSSVTTRNITSSWAQYSVTINESDDDVKIVFDNGNNYMFLDDVVINYIGVVPSYVSGYENLNVSNVTSYNVVGLEPATTYYYRVRAVGTNSTSENSNVIPVTTSGPATWSGTAWSNVSGPTATIDAIIDGNFTSNGTDQLPFTAQSLTVNADKTLTVSAGQTITVQNTITNNGTITVEHQGSLVQMNDAAVNSGTGTYNIKKSTGGYYQYDYIYWSSPIENQLIQDVFKTIDGFNNHKYQFVPDEYNDTKSGLKTGLAQTGANADGYDDEGNDWTPFATGTMQAGLGYIVMGKGSTFPFSIANAANSVAGYNVEFSGNKVNNGEISVNLSLDKYHLDAMGGFDTKNINLNLVGNPYPSSISAATLFNANSTLIEPNFYFWTHAFPIAAISGPYAYDFSNDSFASATVSGSTVTTNALATGLTGLNYEYIASGQGFFVQAKNDIDSGNDALVFNNSMRGAAYPNTSFLKTSYDNELSRIWLSLTEGNGNKNNIAVGFSSSATDNYGINDVPRIDSANDTEFYSLINGVNGDFDIQFMSDFAVEKTIPLGLEILTSGDFSISIDGFDGIFTEGQKIYLEDTYEDVIHNLNEGAYSFTQTAGTNINDRFILRFTNSALGNEESVFNQVKVYPNPSTGVFNIAYYGSETLQYTIYDLTGKTVMTGSGNQINLSQQAIGLYFAKITDGSAVRTLKLVRE